MTLIMSDQCKKYFRPLPTHDIKGSFSSNCASLMQCITNDLYISSICEMFTSEMFTGWFFFLSQLWQKLEWLWNRNFLLVLGCKGQGSHKPSDRWDSEPCTQRVKDPSTQRNIVLCALPVCCVSVTAVQGDEQVWECLKNKLHQSTMRNTP